LAAQHQITESQLKAVTITVGRLEESGIGNIVKNLCANLVAKGYKVHLGVLERKYVLTDVPKECHVFEITHHVRLSRLLGRLIPTPDWQERLTSGDIIHHHQSSLILKSLPFRQAKVILHYHGVAKPEFEEKGTRALYEARQIRNNAPKAAAIIAVSQFAKKELEELCEVKCQTDVIYPGVDTGHYTLETPAKYRKGAPSFLFVGAIAKKKAVNRLVDAMTLIRKDHPSAFLRIIGSGPRLSELSEHIQKLSLTRNVEMISSWVPLHELPFYYASCDAYVSSSIWESFGLPVLEAMACGKPIVGPSVGSYPELIRESSAGEIYHSGNSEELATTMTRVALNAEKYRRNARDFALRHNWQTMTDSIERVYERVAQT
jgi:glycosyltransferase involved in cell wall biosynthesis